MSTLSGGVGAHANRREVNDLTQKLKPRPVRPLVLLAATLLMAALCGHTRQRHGPGPVPARPDSDDVTLVTGDRQMVERKKEGEFVARPVFSRRTDVLYYSIRHPDTGDWITSTYRVQGGGKQLSEGWSTPSSTPPWTSSPSFTPSRLFCWCWPFPEPAAATTTSSTPWSPSTSPRGFGDKVLGALDPDRWARAGARWVIQGVHGTLCGVVEGVTQTEITECGEG